jgi:hypothetical protein
MKSKMGKHYDHGPVKRTTLSAHNCVAYRKKLTSGR